MNKDVAQTLTIWVLTEGIAGTENQCLGIAEAIGGDILVKKIGLKWPYSWISPHLSWGEGPAALTANSDAITPPFPDIVIAGGRKAVGSARFIKRASQNRTIVIVVQNPHTRLDSFDVVASPVHDQLRGPNVIQTDGAANRITQDILDVAALAWSTTLANLPNPRIAVMIGGTSKTHRFGTRQMQDLIVKLKTLQNTHHAGLMITVSRRTPRDLVSMLHTKLKDPMTYIYDGNGANPYAGFLALADYIVCTSDSVSMLSDAATTGKPVYMVPLPGGSAKFDRFYTHLAELGVIREFDGTLENWEYPPFDDARRVARAVTSLLQDRHSEGIKK
jgi:uncharacterized protein